MRLAALGALVVALVGVAFVLLRSGDDYEVQAQFVSASQLVDGNLVTVAGEPVGSVKRIELTDDGQARVTFTVDPAYAPLRRGTVATVRQASLSGVANRYIDLALGGARGREIPDGGMVEADNTQSAVDLDQLFNIFEPKTRRNTQKTIELFREFNAGRTDEANAALRYLNPVLSASARLFSELNRDPDQLERFIVEDARLVTDLAAQDDTIAALIENLSTSMGALAAERDELGRAIDTLPAFLRKSNTTFVNIRAALDDLRPLVNASKPVVRDKLIPLFDELRPFARDAEPTIRDLSRTISREGRDNDLIDLLNRQRPLERAANAPRQVNGEERKGAFPQIQEALKGATPQLAFFRPYTPEFVGWFDDFSHPGIIDALGGINRAGLGLNGFTFSPTTELLPVPPELRLELFGVNTVTGLNHRCPGALERPAPDGSNPWIPEPGFNCNPEHGPPYNFEKR